MTDIDAVYFCIYMNQTFYILQLNSILLSDYRHTNICVYTIKYIYICLLALKLKNSSLDLDPVPL